MSDEHDPVQRPAHYTSHPSGVECRTIARHMTYNLGSALKYIWRAGLKGDAVEDLRKAANAINDEISRIEAEREAVRARLVRELEDELNAAAPKRRPQPGTGNVIRFPSTRIPQP